MNQQQTYPSKKTNEEAKADFQEEVEASKVKDKPTRSFIKRLAKVFMLTNNPPPRQFYNSLMLQNGGKLVIKI